MNWSIRSIRHRWLTCADLCCASGAGSYSSHLVPDEAVAAAEKEVSREVFVCLRERFASIEITKMTKQTSFHTFFAKSMYAPGAFRFPLLYCIMQIRLRNDSMNLSETQTSDNLSFTLHHIMHLTLKEKGAACTHSTVPSGMYVQIYASGRHWKPFPCPFGKECTFYVLRSFCTKAINHLTWEREKKKCSGWS